MRNSNFWHMPTGKLRQAAEAEAQAFAFPFDWQNGRELRQALAIDAAPSKDIDDAISAEWLSGSEAILRVSVADVGSFIASYQDLVDDTSALVANAARQAQTRYRRHEAAYPMLPRVMSENYLSLLHGQERPVLTFHMLIDKKGRPGDLEITKDRIITERTTFDIVNYALSNPDDDEFTYKVQMLESVALLLFMGRHDGDKQIKMALENERGDQIAQGNGTTAQVIVQEAMIATGSLFAQYMRANHVPALYRKHIVYPKDMPAGQVPRKRLSQLAIASYSTFPDKHLGLNVDCYLQGASPLRRVVDLFNHCNLVAFRDGKEPPFNRRRMADIGRRMSHTKQKPGAIYEVGLQIESPTMPDRLTRPLAGAIAKVKGDNPDIADMVTAFFGQAQGNAAELRAAQEAVVAHIATSTSKKISKAILVLAIQKGLLTKAISEDTEGKHILRSPHGQEYAYEVDTRGMPTVVSAANVLSQISGLEVSVRPPADVVVPARKKGPLSAPHRFLQTLHFQKKGLIHWVTKPPENASVEGEEQSVTAHVLTNGKYYEATALHASPQKAQNQACLELIQSLNLRHESLVKPPTDTQLHYKFRIYLQKRGLPLPTMSFQREQRGSRSVNRCELNIIDAEGISHIFMADAETKDAAKLYSTQAAFNFMQAHIAAGEARQAAIATKQEPANDPPPPIL